MPLELLRELSIQSLPVTLDQPSDLDKVRVLRAAGLIAALLHRRPDDATSAGPCVAQVLAITARGRTALARGELPERLPRPPSMPVTPVDSGKPRGAMQGHSSHETA